jgi:prevent-host-death family protein
MADRVIHISEAEAASDFAAVLERVRAGAEVVIESGKLPIAVVRPAEPYVRLLSESIALAKAHADLEDIINSRKPREISSWE